MAQKNPFRRRSKIVALRLDSLEPAPVGIQRPFQPAHAQAIADDFQIDWFAFPVVVRVDGVNWVIDGQHGVEAFAPQSGLPPDPEIECEVFDGLSEQDRALLFLGRNNTRAVSAYDRFRVRLTARCADEVAVDQLVRQAGLQISAAPRRACVGAVSALMTLYRRHGPGVLARALHLLLQACSGHPEAFRAVHLYAFCEVVARYPELGTEVLLGILSAHTNGVRALLIVATQERERLRRPLYQCVAAAVVGFYNSSKSVKRKNRLEHWWADSAPTRPRG